MLLEWRGERVAIEADGVWSHEARAPGGGDDGDGGADDGGVALGKDHLRRYLLRAAEPALAVAVVRSRAWWAAGAGGGRARCQEAFLATCLDAALEQRDADVAARGRRHRRARPDDRDPHGRTGAR